MDGKTGRFRPGGRALANVVVLLGGLAAMAFVLAAAAFPGGGYNPAMQMLSVLGRSEVRLVEQPWCRYLFVAGMFFSAAAVLVAARAFRLSAWGAALNAAGLVAIALFPENEGWLRHDAACWAAASGGAVMLFGWMRSEPSRRMRFVWLALLLLSALAMALALSLHSLRVAPFAPWVTSAQKLMILSFAAWLVSLSSRGARRLWLVAAWLAVPALLAAWLALRPAGPAAEDILKDAPEASADDAAPLPVSDDELAGLAWLERVTGRMDAADEREWWDIGGSQHGIFAKRYNIAFAGYAAAAIGMRGDAAVRARAGAVLGACVERMLRRDVWGYSQSEGYWGRKPWAPDPCHRENVMYTGHLLQLLALYELFTGDRRYHRGEGGWDFVWRDGRKVHYDVEKLVATTVDQMRRGPNGGIACEPGLVFFPCNNHPHVALALLRRLGWGDWSADAARWERWALAHYLSPSFGGGAISLVYHMRGNFMYPRGQGGLDGWSLLWYEAWASDRRLATALWGRARGHVDFSRLEACGDELSEAGCCDPQPVPPSVEAVFLAAAARACSDPETASRLERAVDARCLRREGGLLWLDLDRRWRIGATAMRLVSLAESNGSRFRSLCGLDHEDQPRHFWYNSKQ